MLTRRQKVTCRETLWHAFEIWDESKRAPIEDRFQSEPKWPVAILAQVKHVLARPALPGECGAPCV